MVESSSCATCGGDGRRRVFRDGDDDVREARVRRRLRQGQRDCVVANGGSRMANADGVK